VSSTIPVLNPFPDGGAEPLTPGPAAVGPESVGLARSGDPCAWGDLVRRYSCPLTRVALRCGLSADDAADVVQTTWLICVEKLDQLCDDAALLGWLITITRREAYRVATQARRCEPCDVDALPAGRGVRCADDVAVEVCRRDDLARLSSAIGDLPARQRSVLRLLSATERVDYLTAARELGVPVGSLGPTRARAVQRLRRDPRLALAG
jgi:RNA polymerase sigma factor (sigma-70 family)